MWLESLECGRQKLNNQVHLYKPAHTLKSHQEANDDNVDKEIRDRKMSK